MAKSATTRSASGVLLFDDFRDNLIIDRYDPCFVTMRASKKKHMRSQNSEDVVTWNVFRSLRQVDPNAWVPRLFGRAFGSAPVADAAGTTVELWKNVNPPPALLEGGDEGSSEIDIVVEHPLWVWFIEAKWTSDISTRTSTRPTRHQVLRNIDVGSYYAGVRDFYFSLLIKDRSKSPAGAKAVEAYTRIGAREALPHRPDGLGNCRGVGFLTWADMATVMGELVPHITRPDEVAYANRCLQWLELQRIVPPFRGG